MTDIVQKRRKVLVTGTARNLLRGQPVGYRAKIEGGNLQKGKLRDQEVTQRECALKGTEDENTEEGGKEPNYRLNFSKKGTLIILMYGGGVKI